MEPAVTPEGDLLRPHRNPLFKNVHRRKRRSRQALSLLIGAKLTWLQLSRTAAVGPDSDIGGSSLLPRTLPLTPFRRAEFPAVISVIAGL
jgi:hypothetical protein